MLWQSGLARHARNAYPSPWATRLGGSCACERGRSGHRGRHNRNPAKASQGKRSPVGSEARPSTSAGGGMASNGEIPCQDVQKHVSAPTRHRPHQPVHPLRGDPLGPPGDASYGTAQPARARTPPSESPCPGLPRCAVLGSPSPSAVKRTEAGGLAHAPPPTSSRAHLGVLRCVPYKGRPDPSLRPIQERADGGG